MPFLFAPHPQPVIPVDGERYEFFPVNRVYGIAANVGERSPKAAFFMKPGDALRCVDPKRTETFEYPPATEKLFYEVELVVCLKKGGFNMTLEEAREAVYGFCVGIDWTRKDLQEAAKAESRSWEEGKVFEGSAMVSPVRPIERTPLPHPTEIYLYKNNEKVQSGLSTGFARSYEEIIVELSKIWTLKAGDVIFAGTPAGAGPVARGDRIKAGINGVGTIDVAVD